jgi:hypothetical protein
MFSRAIEVYREEGAVTLLRKVILFAYNEFTILFDDHVRPRLPVEPVEYSGIAVPAGRRFDSLLPWIEHRETYEWGLVNRLREHVEPGDHVVVVGGGWGVTTCAAAIQTTENGSVTVFEGATDEVEYVQQTAALNEVADRVRVRHAVVGTAKVLRSDPGDADHVDPSELPDCDVLQMDCEGSELEILREMEANPRAVLVETHDFLDSSETEIRAELAARSYDVVSREVADPGLREFCEENGVYVLTAVRSDTRGRE